MILDETVITSVIGIFTVPAEKGRYIEIKNRPSYALSFCLDGGRIVYTKDGVRTVSDRDTAVILPQGADYTLYNEEGGNFPVINFLTSKPIAEDFIAIKLSYPELYLKDYETIRRLWHIPGNNAMVMSLLYGMLARLASENLPRHPALGTAMEYILGNLSTPELSNEILAEVSGISEVYLRRLFKEHYDTTPKQYILSLRIKEAKRLLDEGLTSVGAVAEACGFSGIYHFSRMFKTVTGVSPSEYVKRSK